MEHSREVLSEIENTKAKLRREQSVRLLLLLVLWVIIVEAATTAAIFALPVIPALWIEMLFKAALTALLSAPALYFIWFRSLRSCLVSMERAQEAVRSKSAVQKKFLQIVSQQLRAPLSAMRWNLEAFLAGRPARRDRGQAELIETTYAASLEVIDRTRDLLLAFEMSENRIPLERQYIAIERLIGELLAGFKKRAGQKNISIEYSGPSGPLPPVSVDGAKIRAAVEKLMDNALTYTPEGRKVSARLYGLKSAIRFEVADTGIGIPLVDQPHIFEIFYRAPNAMLIKPEASGLSLAIVKHYVELHGGKVGFQSEEGKGSTFWFELPNV